MTKVKNLGQARSKPPLRQQSLASEIL
ncbi:hypothetical protein DSM3645_30166 [Blastopirellula marina DSM 3645]|uniref:Uncharacterized protein n=1 Tax=Blastopirellula marina DSM 3645 TaxID=314230 RepID=A3ZXA5_9BACT|nr:hypothetical protein DSM3645_30166 [Blastopirellula marina DSM 3645]